MVQKRPIFNEFFFRYEVDFFLTQDNKRGCPGRAGHAFIGRHTLLSGYSVGVTEEKSGPRRPDVGLCANCGFMRLIESDRGSTFYLCERSATDATFPRYPRLPVLQCAGYQRLSVHLEGE